MPNVHNKTSYEEKVSRKRWCYTNDMPLQKIVLFDNVHYLVEEGEDSNFVNEDQNSTHSHGRMAFSHPITPDQVWKPIVPRNLVHRHELEKAIKNHEGAVVYGRKCTCAQGPDDYYCPVQTEICRVWENGVFLGSRGSPTLQCETSAPAGQDWAIRFVLPLVVFIYLFLMCFLVGTDKGKNAIKFNQRLVCCWEEEQYERALAEEVEDRARQSFYRQLALDRARRILEPSRKVRASLKTRAYNKTVMNQECSICLADFEEGDRVGDLPCGHTFHVAPCLKQWLKRKNHCPLCHASCLAVPIEDESPQDNLH